MSNLTPVLYGDDFAFASAGRNRGTVIVTALVARAGQLFPIHVDLHTVIKTIVRKLELFPLQQYCRSAA